MTGATLARGPHENERKIVRGHPDDLAQLKPVRRGSADQIIDIANAHLGSRLLRSASKAALDGAV